MAKYSGKAACDRTIERMVGLAARRIFKEGCNPDVIDQIDISLPATTASLPEYYQLERFADREEYHARLEMFISAGSVKADWDRRAGDKGQLTRISMHSLTKAAEILGIDLPWEIARTAVRAIEDIATPGLPSVEQIKYAWLHGKVPGGVPADKAVRFIDSMRVIQAAEKLGGQEQDLLLRRLSIELFGDSKRIESLVRPLSYLLGGDETTDGSDVFSKLGLVKHPQPMLISGPNTCGIRVKGGSVLIIHPYIGIRPDTIEGIKNGNNYIRRVLTIENLASFNEAAEHPDNPDDLLMVYVAGNPTPSLLSAYAIILRDLQPSNVMHWGDIDVGGFKIAARLAEKASSVGQNINLWKMNPEEIAICQKENAGAKETTEIINICKKYGWVDEAKGVTNIPAFQEQEAIKWNPHEFNV
jgi:hypothetical protein